MDIQEDFYKRVSLEEAKSYWFGNDLTVCIYKADNLSPILALPRIEIQRGIHYIERLRACTNYADYENIYGDYLADSRRPRFIPQLFALEVLPDFKRKLLLDFLGVNELTPEQEESFFEEVSEWEFAQVMTGDFETEHPFYLHRHSVDLNELSFKWDVDEADAYEGLTHWIQWTSAWMPLEITSETGLRSEQFLDHEKNPIYIYSNLEQFVEIWEKHGFAIETNSPELNDFVTLATKFSALFQA